jgi:AraC-like DNA-binding protein
MSFNNIYLINIVLSIVLIFEISKYFKKKQILKFQFIGLLFSLLTLNLYLIEFNKSSFGFVLHLLGLFGILIFLINIFTILYQYKINKQFVIFGLVLFFSFLFLLLYRAYHYQSVLDSDIAPFVNNKNKSISVIKLISQIFAAGVAIYFGLRILKNTDKDFYYHRILRSWIYLFILVFGLCIVLTIVVLIDGFYSLNISFIYDYNFGLFIQEFLYLFVLFRPRYLDAEEIKYSISDIMNLSNNKELKKVFHDKFFKAKYYLNPNASLSEFAILINVNKDVLNDYLKLEQHQNFIELVNSKRLDHFILLVDDNKHKEYTIEALSMQCGFGTRQSLYQTFKKVKGCSPTDYILSITN